MKIVVPIFLSFTNPSTYSVTVATQIPFPVKFIHFKSIGYQAKTATNAYVTLKSDMTDFQTIAVCAQINRFDTTQIDNLIEFPIPKRISGNYNWYLYGSTGLSTGSTTTGPDTIAMIAEFYDDNSFPPMVKIKKDDI